MSMGREGDIGVGFILHGDTWIVYNEWKSLLIYGYVCALRLKCSWVECSRYFRVYHTRDYVWPSTCGMVSHRWVIQFRRPLYRTSANRPYLPVLSGKKYLSVVPSLLIYLDKQGRNDGFFRAFL
jgi:hypothetical protein